MPAAASLHSERLERVCSCRLIKLAQHTLHSSPIALPSEPGNSLHGPMLPVARSHLKDEQLIVSCQLISHVLHMLHSCPIAQLRIRGSSLRGAQSAHSRRQARLQDSRRWSGRTSSMARLSTQLTGASKPAAVAGATTNSRT